MRNHTHTPILMQPFRATNGVAVRIRCGLLAAATLPLSRGSIIAIPMARHDQPTLPQTRPAGICAGPGHVLIYGNPAFHAQFGARCIGMPAREVMVDLPETAFALFDAVLERGRPLARWIERDGHDWRLTAMPRRDPATELVDGIAFHLRARDDSPVVERGAGR
jgi:hypothetical protein